MDLLVLENISKLYDSQFACNNISLTIKEGEFFTLLGPSGCGKTTLLRLIAGFINPDKGAIYLDGIEISNLAIEKRNVGMVFQNYALFPHLNVFDNVAYGLKIKKFSKREIQKRVNNYLSLMNLQSYANRKVSELSGGEQQRVALARTLVTEPKLLLLDEPLSNLDAKLKEKMRIELKDIQQRLGITTIFVTHDQREAFAISDRIAVLNEGECIQVDTPNNIYNNPINSFVATFVGETNLLELNNAPFLLPSLANGKYLSLRPQHIQISQTPQHTNNEFAGKIKRIQVNGALTAYEVIIENITLKVFTLNNHNNNTLINIDDIVYLSFDSANLCILKS